MCVPFRAPYGKQRSERVDLPTFYPSGPTNVQRDENRDDSIDLARKLAESICRSIGVHKPMVEDTPQHQIDAGTC